MKKRNNVTIRRRISLCQVICYCWFIFSTTPLFSQVNNCATVVSNQILSQLIKDRFLIEKHIQQYLNHLGPDQQESITLPIQAFIINRDDGTGGISLIAVQEAVHTLNINFSRLKVRFSLCEPPVVVASTQFFEFHSSLESELVSSYYVPNTINVYFVNNIDNGFYTGYSYMPGGPDIIIIDNDYANKYPFSHEMGHFFGLYHIHNQDTCPISTLKLDLGEDHLCDTWTAPDLTEVSCFKKVIGIYNEPAISIKNTKGSIQVLDQLNMMSCESSHFAKHFTPVQFALMDYYLNRVRNYFKECNGFKTCVLPVVTTKDTGYTYFSLAWNYQGNNTPFNFRYRQEGLDNWTTIKDCFSNTIIVTDLSPCTSYEYQIQRICPDAKDSTLWTSSDFIKTGGCADVYLPSYGQSSTEWIAQVQIGTIHNASQNNHGYGYFGNLTTNIRMGVATKIKLTPGTNDEITRNLTWNIWVDLNRDHDFLDQGEMVLQLSGKDNQSVSGIIFLPHTTSSGSTRMRISLSRSSLNSPNSVGGFREVEDYTLNISNNKSDSNPNSFVHTKQGGEKDSNNAFQPNLTWQYFIANHFYSKTKIGFPTEFPTENLELFDLQGRIDYHVRLNNIYNHNLGFGLSDQPKNYQLFYEFE